MGGIIEPKPLDERFAKTHILTALLKRPSNSRFKEEITDKFTLDPEYLLEAGLAKLKDEMNLELKRMQVPSFFFPGSPLPIEGLKLILWSVGMASQ